MRASKELLEFLEFVKSAIVEAKRKTCFYIKFDWPIELLEKFELIPDTDSKNEP